MVCSFVEQPSGTFTVRIVENGELLDEHVSVNAPQETDAWNKAWAYATSVRATYQPRALAAMRPIYLRLRAL
jgi:hypothetical protein